MGRSAQDLRLCRGPEAGEDSGGVGPHGPPPPYPVGPLPAGAPPGATRRHPRLSFRIATVAGIDVRVHATFALLVLLVAAGSTAPDQPGVLSASGWLVMLFACVVVHELSHSLVARRYGIPIDEIELLPIGGVSKMARTPEDPAVELRIAAAGPIASVALACAFAAVAALAGVPLWPPTLYGGPVVARLAWVNLMLAGFNLLPALPLDGGRVLRALLEPRAGRQRATHVAAAAARALAALMVVAGMLTSVWLVVIGVFVYLGSWAEEAAAAVHERIKDVRVRHVMLRAPITVLDTEEAAAVAVDLWHSAQRDFPVVTVEGRYVGLVTVDRLFRAGPGEPVGALADRDAATLAPDDMLERSGLIDGTIGAATVLDAAGQVVGMARADDAARLVERLVRRGEQRR